MMPRPVVLMVLDGFGLGEDAPDNAIRRAPARAFFSLWDRWPHTTLLAHGEAVGLTAGQMGDSNVGHLTLGAGRVVYQNLARIERAIASGELAANPVLTTLLQDTATRGGRLHLFGLLSHGGVHSHRDHVVALLSAARAAGVDDVVLHLNLDGRDVPPQSALTEVAWLADHLDAAPAGTRVGTVMGRYYGMDRDHRWDRTERAYRAMVAGEGPRGKSVPEVIAAAYAAGITDEFVPPTVLEDAAGAPTGLVRAEDAVLFFNFRADRMRQMAACLTDPAFDAFDRLFPAVREAVSMTLYDEAHPLPHLFAPPEVPDNLASWLDQLGWSQLHVAETEKYAHVTFFFNGGVEAQLPGEERVLVPSPAVATYELAPEMSAAPITQVVLDAVDHDRYDFILVNYANCDMVGHTGDLEATRAAVRAVDEGIRVVAEHVLRAGGLLVITADHGNAEHMRRPDGGPDTNHTSAPVPLVLVGASGVALKSGGLADVAPTLLQLLGLPIPEAMTGQVLLVPPDGGATG